MMFPPALLLTAAFLLLALSPQTAKAAEAVNYRGKFQWLNAGVMNSLRCGNMIDPKNTNLQIPHTAVISEARPDIQLISGNLTLIARPQIKLSAESIKANSKQQPLRLNSKGSFTELYGQWILSDAVTAAFGRHSYQWGPAETLSPSNKIFHETALVRDLLYTVKGRHLARVNFSLGRQLSLIVMTEYEENKEIQAFTADQPFESVSLIKGEYASDNGANYIGIVGGRQQIRRGWVGEYFNVALPFAEGFSFYGDLSHERGSAAWYPVTETQITPQGAQEIMVMRQERKEDYDIITTAAAGLRYDFENGSTVRTEYIHHEAGYTKSKQKLLMTALTSQQPQQLAAAPDNLRRISANGLELLGQRYVYASAMIPNPGNIKDLMAYARMLRSLTDQSSNSYVSIEYNVNDHGTIIAAASLAYGRASSELAGLVKHSYTAGYRHSW